MNPKFILRQFLCIAGFSSMAISSVSAQSTYIWDNSNVSNTANTFDWFTGGLNTQGLWTGGAPLSNNQNTIQFFANTTTPLVHTSSVVQGSNLNNGGTAFQLGTLTLSGLATNSANITLTMNVTGDAFNFSAATGAINLDTIQVGGNGRNITWNVSNAFQLGTASSASTLTLAGNGSSTFNFSGGFTELQSGGGSKLVKSGSSITTLSGAVTLSGGLELNAGTLRLTNVANAITGGITLNGGSLGDNGGTISTATLNNNQITVNGAANLGLSGGATTNGGITLNSGANLTLATNNSGATVNGAVTGVGSLSIDRLGGGSHTQNLNSTENTFTGTISFTGTSVVTLNTNSLADSASLGAGNIRFVGSASTSAHTFALGSGAIAPVTLNNRRIEIVSGSAATYTVNNNSSQAFTINTDLLVGATGARSLTLGGTGTGLSTFGGKIENGSGTVSISKAGSGTWLFSGDNTYTGTTTVSAGDLITTKTAALPGYNSAAKVIFSGGTLGVRVGGSGWSTAQVDTLLTNATKTSGSLGIDTTNGDLTQWTAFTTANLGSALGIKKLGDNTLTLNQSNTFAGALTISQGTVSINTINNASAAGVLGNSANAVVLGSFGNTGTLLYTGATASSTKTFTAATSGTAGFNVQEAGTNLTLSGAISGSGDVTKLGSGILTLGAANIYTGATTVNGGELRWGIANAIAGGALNINDSGTVNIQTFTDSVGTVTLAKGGSIIGTTGTLTTGSFISNNGGTMTGATLILTNGGSVTYNSSGPGSTTLQIDKLTVNDSGTNTFDIADGDAAVDFDITGFVNNGGNNVGRTIIKTGAGAMQFSGSTLGGTGQNSISLNINEGAVLMNRATGVAFLPGGNAGITVGDSTGSAGTAILKFASTGGDNQLGTRPITINSDGLFDLNGKTQSSGNTLTLNGAGELQLNNGQLTATSLTLNPSAGNTTTLSLGGTGILTLGGDVTLNAAGTGRAQITGSDLSLGAANRIFNVGLGTGADYDLLVGAGISGATRSLTKNGTGRLVLTGSNTYSGGTIVNAGTLQIGDGTTAGTMTSTGALTMGNATFAVRGPASGGSSQTVASLATSASTGSIIRLTPGASGTTTLTITSATLSTGAGSSVNFDYTAGTTVGGTVGNNSVVWNPALTGGIIGGAYTVTDSGGTGFATKNGTNIVRLTDSGSSGLPVGTGSATGSYFLASGYSTVSTTAPGSLVQELSGAVAASNVTVNTSGLASGANLALGSNLLTLGAGMVFDGPNAYEISGSGVGGLRSSTSGGTINLYNANTDTVTISSPIVANGASRLTIDGPGTTVLSGTNTYTGATVVNGGTVRFSGTMAASAITINNGVAQLGTATGLTSSNSVTFGAGSTGSLQLLGNNLTIGALSSNAVLGTPVITNNNAADVTLTIDSGSGTTFGGVIQDGTGGGTLALTKSGAGTLTLTGVNTYSGGMTINAGAVSVTSDANLGDVGGGITLNGGRLTISGVNLNTTRNITVSGTGSSMVVNKNCNFSTSGNLTGSGSLTFVDPGGSGTTPIHNFTSSGNTFTGSMTMPAMDVRVSSLGDAAGNNIVFTGAGTFSLNSSGVTAGLTFNNRAIELSNTSATVSNNNATHAISIGSNLVATGAAAKTLTLGAVAGPTNVFSGNIANGTGGGTVGITKSGTGTWRLIDSVSSYTGVTTISDGVLEVIKLANGGSNSSIGASTNAAANLVFNGGTLRYTGAGDSTDRAMTFGASGNNLGFILNASGTGAVAFTNTAAITNSQTGSSQARFYTLSGTNTSDNILAAQITNNGSNATALTKGGPGKWVLTSTNSSYTGGMFIQGGTLEIRSGASALTHTAGTTSLGTNVGEATLIANKAGAGTLTMSLAGYSRNAGGSANIISTGGTNGSDNTINMTGAAGFINAGLFFGGSEFAARNATNGFVRALSYGSDPSAAAVNTITASNHVKLTSSPANQNNLTLLSLNLRGDAVNWTNNSGQTLTSPGILKSGGGSSTISGGNVTGGSNTELVIRTDTASDSLTISSILSQGSGALTKSGAGTLTLSGNNTFTGQTHVNAGTLTISANNNLGAESTGATLNLKGGTLQATSTFGFFNGSSGTNNRNVTLLNQSNIEVTSNNTLTIAGVMSNNSNAGLIAPGFNMTGTGTLVLTGANTYTGSTVLNAGTLAFNNGSLGSSGNIAFTGSSTLQWNVSNTQDISSRIVMANGINSAFDTNGNDVSFASGIGSSTSGALTKMGSGTLYLNAANTYTGATTVSGGMLAITGTGSINSSSGITVASGAHFKYNSTTALTTSLTLDAGATLSGSGTIHTSLTLSSLNNVLAPGNSPGIQTFGVDQIWESFTYEWELNDWVDSVVGTDIDQIQITGGLTLSGTSYALNIFSLDALNAAGLVGANGGNLFTETSKSWTILTTTTGITGFNANAWTLNTNGFLDAETGNWSLASTGNDLVLSYTVIPEPKAALLGGLGILLLFRRRR